MNSFPHLCLASKSPRRLELIKSLNLPFYTCAPQSEEAHPRSLLEAGRIILSNAEEKALSVEKRIRNPGDIVVAADTLVLVNGKVLGKPQNRSDAFRLLKLQSGKQQRVFTGLVLYSPQRGIRRKLVRSSVWFHRLPKNRINEYLRTSEPYDKAGAYAIQGLGALFIRKTSGSYTNVMGFPLEIFLKELEDFSGLSLFNWCRKRAP